MKMNVEWHARNLDNARHYADQMREKIKRDIACLERADADNLFRAYQLDSAYKEGKDQYDADKYKVERKRRAYE